MAISNASRTTVLLLVAAAGVALASMAKGAGGLTITWFHPWVLAPYVGLFFLLCFPEHQSRERVMAGSVAALLVLLFSGFVYISSMWFSRSSTSSLIFVFAPLYVFAGGVIVWRVALFVLQRWFATATR